MTRVVHLDHHVSRVQASVLDLLDSPNCNLLLLSDLQVAVLAQMTFPYVKWATRLIEDHGQWQETVEFPQHYRDELECLELLLSGGATMTCDLSVVLADLADAIRNQPSGGAGCAPGGPAAILNCVTSMTPEELIPQDEVDAPQYGVPPAGFDTWEEYTIHKCKAAYAIVDAVAGLFGVLSLAPIAAITYQAISALLTGYLGGIALGAVAFSPAAIVAIAAGAVALGLLAGGAYIYLNDVKAYILDHKDELACSLYASGSSAVAQAAIASAVEDAIQSVAWVAIFGPVIGTKIATILGGIASQTVSNNLVNPLFRVAEDFVYPDVDCSTCGEECEEQIICDFSVDLDGATLYDEEGGLGYLVWDDTVTPPGPSAKTGQLVGHETVWSGWQMPQSFIIPSAAVLDLTQYTPDYVTTYIHLQLAGEWELIAQGDFRWEHHFEIDLAALAGQWCTGIRWSGARGAAEAWWCHIADVTLTCA